MEQLATALLVWIAAHSDLETRALPLPEIVLMSPQTLTREYYTGAPHLIPKDGVDDRLNALYAAEDGPNGTIYTLAPAHIDGAADFDDPADNPLFREIILHELVHHAQWQTGQPESWACQSQGEKDAYHLGGHYLKELRVTDPIPNRNFWAHMYSLC